jgi:hypothetical protein
MLQEYHVDMINTRERSMLMSYLFQLLEKYKCSLFAEKVNEK